VGVLENLEILWKKKVGEKKVGEKKISEIDE
jgi:hypothetical protein